MSKSGLFAYFGSKEKLQLATVERAREIVVAEIVEPSLALPSGIERLRALCEHWLALVESPAFPDGCFISRTVTAFANVD